MARQLHLDLPDDLDRFVADHAAGDEAGYVRNLLRQQMERDALRQSLRAGIDRGLDDLAAGRFVTLDADGLRVELEAVKAAGRDRRQWGA